MRLADNAKIALKKKASAFFFFCGRAQDRLIGLSH